MNPRTWMIWLAVLLVPLVACQGPSRRAASTKPGLVMASEDSAAGPADNLVAGAFYNDGSEGDVRGGTGSFGSIATLDDVTNGLQQTGAQPAAPAERLLVYHGQIRVEVARPDDALAQLLAQVKQWGGYLQSQQGTTLTVRIPAARFDEAFVFLRAAGRVLGESRQADDVTEEFVDLGIRIDNARRARDRLLEVLKLADKVEDILKVEAELRRLTEEIERMEGRKKFLADQVAMATLQAVFTAVAEAPVAKRSRRPSRFWWINEVGAEWVMEGF